MSDQAPRYRIGHGYCADDSTSGARRWYDNIVILNEDKVARFILMTKLELKEDTPESLEMYMLLLNVVCSM